MAYTNSISHIADALLQASSQQLTSKDEEWNKETNIYVKPYSIPYQLQTQRFSKYKSEPSLYFSFFKPSTY